MKTFKLPLVIGLICMISIQSRCKKDNDDPCSKTSLFKADFVIGETIQDSLVLTDTIVNVNFQVTLKASEKYESIKWKIGEDLRGFENQQTVKLSFKPDNVGQTIKVALFAKGKSDPTCPLLPNDDGLDTIFKQFTIGCNKNIGGCLNTGSNLQQSYIGKWRGSIDDNPNRQFDIQIVDFGPDPNSRDDTLFYDIRIFNLPEGCGGTWLPQNYNGCGGQIITPASLSYPITEPFYKGFYTSSTVASTCCPSNIAMFGKIDDKDKNKIIVYLKYKSNGSTKVFSGTRL